jgi:hypothetical protein
MNSKGQSLVGIMISLAIFSIMSVSIFQINANMVKSNMTFQANSDMQTYVNQLRGDVQYSTNATASVGGQDVTQPIQFKDPLTGLVIAAPGYKQQPSNAWQVNSVSFSNVVSIPSQSNYYRATLSISFTVDNTRVYGSSGKTSIIGDVYCTIVSNIIQFCYGSTDLMTMAQSNCTALGGSWNANLAYGSQCVFPVNPIAAATASSGNIATTASNGNANPNNSSPCDNPVWNH